MSAAEGSDRLAALKEFDESKTGVRGLVESGVTAIPPIFRYPNLRPSAAFAGPELSIPTIDLSLPRSLAVDLIRAASCDWGFFQIVNHDVPLSVIDRTISAVRAFNELPPAERSKHYSRSTAGGVSYFSNVDLYQSTAASWRDTIQMKMGPVPADPDRIPAVCRAELVAWDKHVTGVGRAVLGMLAEGLGLGPGLLEQMTCLEGRAMACHYYPPCPEPDLTLGIADHTDPGVLTVLLQDHIGGLEVKKKGEDGEFSWVDVKPLPGALVINVGDLLQIFSNDEYKSVQHRVVANSRQEARVSIAVFFNPGKRGESDLYGPLEELVSPEEPAHYRSFTISEFLGTFFRKQLASKSLIEHFKL